MNKHNLIVSLRSIKEKISDTIDELEKDGSENLFSCRKKEKVLCKDCNNPLVTEDQLKFGYCKFHLPDCWEYKEEKEKRKQSAELNKAEKDKAEEMEEFLKVKERFDKLHGIEG